MGTQHIRLNKKVYPISVDCQHRGSGDNFDWSSSASKVGSEAYSNVVDKPDNGYFGFSGPGH